jgi:hypothetical protein
VGRYVDVSDSFHIYGSYFKDLEPELAKMAAEPDYRTRAWESTHPAVEAMFADARRKLAANPDYMKG